MRERVKNKTDVQEFITQYQGRREGLLLPQGISNALRTQYSKGGAHRKGGPGPQALRGILERRKRRHRRLARGLGRRMRRIIMILPVSDMPEEGIFVAGLT